MSRPSPRGTSSSLGDLDRWSEWEIGARTAPVRSHEEIVANLEGPTRQAGKGFPAAEALRTPSRTHPRDPPVCDAERTHRRFRERFDHTNYARRPTPPALTLPAARPAPGPCGPRVTLGTLVQRRRVDLVRVASAGCRRARRPVPGGTCSGGCGASGRCATPVRQARLAGLRAAWERIDAGLLRY
ncbi:hypothetical protein GCM10017562_39500 [Streptomyces roseofulvus]